jgi:hypothetical protein
VTQNFGTFKIWLQCSQELTIQALYNILSHASFSLWPEVLICPSNPQAFFGCPQVLIQYVYSYYPVYLEAVFSTTSGTTVLVTYVAAD